jgi:hypothetical protein
VLVYRFKSSTYVQTLHWLDGPGLLVLVQNLRDGQGWRLTVIDLTRSIAAGQQVVMQTITMSPQDELEGFHEIAPGRGLFLTNWLLLEPPLRERALVLIWSGGWKPGPQALLPPEFCP